MNEQQRGEVFRKKLLAKKLPLDVARNHLRPVRLAIKRFIDASIDGKYACAEDA